MPEPFIFTHVAVAREGWGFESCGLRFMSGHALPVALFIVWLVAGILCRPAATLALIGSAPMTILVCWVVVQQTQGWPGSGDERLLELGQFTLAVGLGLIVGFFARSRRPMRRRRVSATEAMTARAGYATTMPDPIELPNRSPIAAPTNRVFEQPIDAITAHAA